MGKRNAPQSAQLLTEQGIQEAENKGFNTAAVTGTGVLSASYGSLVDLRCCVGFCCQSHIYTHPLLFRFLSHKDHYRVVSRVPCAIW